MFGLGIQVSTAPGSLITVAYPEGSLWVDTVLIARLWRSLKYECVYLDAFEHPHSSLTGYTPGEAYASTQSLALAA